MTDHPTNNGATMDDLSKHAASLYANDRERPAMFGRPVRANIGLWETTCTEGREVVVESVGVEQYIPAGDVQVVPTGILCDAHAPLPHILFRQTGNRGFSAHVPARFVVRVFCRTTGEPQIGVPIEGPRTVARGVLLGTLIRVGA